MGNMNTRLSILAIGVLGGSQLVPAQYITLRGDQFYDENGAPFYPVMMSYYVDFYSPNAPLPEHPTQAEMATVGFGRYVFYTADMSPGYDTPPYQGATGILQDLNEMKADGFNTVRLINFFEKKADQDGFTMKINRYPVPNDNQFVSMDPPYSHDPAVNPVSAKYFEMILAVCNMANDIGMKVSIEPLIGDAMIAANVGDAVNNDRLAFLHALATFIHQNQVHNLIAYEFFGEPTLASIKLAETRTKQDLCELVTSWNETVKAADPDHLTCVGGGYQQDVFRNGWDPMIFPVDFVSIHIYPAIDIHESPGTYLQSLTTRYLDQFRYYDKYLKKPYLVDETGFAGEDPFDPPGYTSPNPYLHYPLACWGDEQDQQEFVVNTFNPIRSSRCAGYSWWIFHNQWVTDPTASNTTPGNPDYLTLGQFKERYFGLLRFGGADPDPAPGQTGWEGSRKLVATTFADYAANPPAPAPMDPVPAALDMNDRYFTPYLHPVNNTTWAGQGATTPWNYGTLTGRVVNQNGNPIAGAVLMGGAFVSPGILANDPTDDVYYNYYTYTDDDGYFEIRGKDPFPLEPMNPDEDPGYTKDGTIQTLEVGAYACSHTGSGWAGEPGNDAFQPNRTYVLNSLQYRFDPVLDGVIVWSGETEDFSGISTLTVGDVVIGGTSELKARYEVHLTPGFEAVAGSECHIYTTPLNLSCEEISDAELRSMEQTGQGSSSMHSTQHTPKEQEEVELNFHFKEPALRMDVFPNPTSNHVLVQLSGPVREIGENWELSLVTSEGQEVIKRAFNGTSYVLDMARMASGTYTVVVRSIDHSLQQRIVKP